MMIRTRHIALLAILYIGWLQLWSEQVTYSSDSLPPIMQKSCHNEPLPELQAIDLSALADTEPGKALLTWAREGAIQIEFASAYDLPQLSQTVRALRVNDDGSVSLEDSFTSAPPGLEVEEAFVTWQDVVVEEGAALLRSEDGTLTIRSNSGVFDVERLEDSCRANNKSGTLSRITLRFPAAPEISVPFAFIFTPNN